MNALDHKSRLITILDNTSQILTEFGKEAELVQLKKVLSLNLNPQDLLTVKRDLQMLLGEALTQIQLKITELKEPTSEDIELFQNYLTELKDYRQELSTPHSEVRKKVTTIIRTSKSLLSADLSNQAIAFPNEYLDAILQSPEAKGDKTGEWVVSKVNEGLSALSEDITVRIGACIDAINELLDSEIQELAENKVVNVSLGTSTTSTSDKMYGVSRQVLPALGIGGLALTLTSAIAAPVVAIGAGLAAGASFLYKGITSSDYQQRKIELKQRLAPKISLAINEMKNHVLEEFSNIEEQVNEYVTEMCTVIAQEMQDCVDAIKSCDNEKKDYLKQQEIFNGQKTCLETYIKQIEIMTNNPFEKKH
jgi:hypothetical protein